MNFRGRDKVFTVHIPWSGPAPGQWSPAVTTPHTVTGNRRPAFAPSCCPPCTPLCHPSHKSYKKFGGHGWQKYYAKCLSEAGKGRAKHIRNSCTYTKLLYLMLEEHLSEIPRQCLLAHPRPSFSKQTYLSSSAGNRAHLFAGLLSG